MNAVKFKNVATIRGHEAIQNDCYLDASNSQGRVARGAGWSLLFNGLQEVFGLATGVVMARLLLPADFGLVAMMGIFIGFADLFRNFGLPFALGQAKEISAEDVSTAMIFSLVVGLCLTVLFMALSIPLAAFYNQPRLTNLVIVKSLCFTIEAPISCYFALLARAFRFKVLGMIAFASKVVGSIIGITCALRGFGTWSLVVSSLFSSVFLLFLCVVTGDGVPRFAFRLNSFKKLVSFGGPVTADLVFTYLFSTSDGLVIGKFKGDAELGIYKRAYSMIFLPRTVFMTPCFSVVFVALSKLQGEMTRFRAAFLKLSRCLILITLPSTLGLGVIAIPFIVGVYGQKWAAAAAPLSILSIGAGCRVIDYFPRIVSLSKGRPDIALKLSMVDGFMSVLCFSIGVFTGGVTGVAWAFSIWSAIWIFPSAHYSLRTADLGVRDQIVNLRGIVGCSVVMALSVFGVQQLGLVDGLPPLLVAASLALGGAAFYVLLLIVFRVPVVGEVRQLANSALPVVRQYLR